MFESEERQIVERIKDYIKDEEPPEYVYIMLRNGRILDFDDYSDMVRRGKLNPKDAYVYIEIGWPPTKSSFHYLLLAWYEDLLFAYLSKLGFYYEDVIVPATGLKYVAAAVYYGDYLPIEVTDLNTATNNLNLSKIVFEVLGDKIISGERELTREEYNKILEMFRSQRLFAGYNFSEAWNIIDEYYDRGNQSLAKEVSRIAMDYYRIFNPYRVCYDMNSWKEVDCWSIKL